MNIVNAEATLVPHGNTKSEQYQFIERVGRICYKSEDRITDDSALGFIENLKTRQHYAMLEHETIYIQMLCCNKNFDVYDELQNWLSNSIIFDAQPLQGYPYIVISENFLSGSFRAFLELISNKNANSPIKSAIEHILQEAYPEIFGNPEPKASHIMDLINEMKVVSRNDFIQFCHEYDDEMNHDDDIDEKDFLGNKWLHQHLTHTVVFKCDRGVSHELVRHRPCSFAQESTRFCNYSHDKFGHNITFIEPLFFDKESEQYKLWQTSMDAAEKNYFALLETGAQPQEARSVLPNSLKTEIVVTATEAEWEHIINLRLVGTTGKPHPQMIEVMKLAYPQLVKTSDNRLKIKE